MYLNYLCICLRHCISYTHADIDECNTTMDACSQMCCNTLGSFVCKCSEGFLLDTDGTSCTRGDEITFDPFDKIFYMCIYFV